MKRQVLFIHSAGAQGLHQGSSDLVAYLQDALGDEYQLIHPKMPDPENPAYTLWKDQLEHEFDGLEGEVLLIGHSLGGSVLLKYLSEEDCQVFISGLFMIAAPHWGEDEDWLNEEYTLPDVASNFPQISQMFFYHSRNDDIVPYAHLGYYMDRFTKAIGRTQGGVEHFFSNGLPELVDDIKQCRHD